MPAFIEGAGNPTLSDDRRLYDKQYPEGLDLHPGSDLHRRITDRILQRIRDSHATMSPKYSQWREIDKSLQIYIPIDEAEKRVKAKDSRKPVSIVIPISLANLETTLAYLTSAFLTDPVFKIEGVSPEDTYGAILLEHLIQQQVLRAKMGLNMHTQWRDGLAYGFGAVGIGWEKQVIGRAVALSDMQNMTREAGPRIYRGQMQKTFYEGSTLTNIDPYTYYPDPNYSIHEVQKGEFVGFLSRESYMSLRTKELTSPDEYFNVQYLKEVRGASKYSSSGIEGSERFEKNPATQSASTTRSYDRIDMWIKLIPDEWGLSSNSDPEMWFFSLVNDLVLVQARPAGLHHNMFPVAVCAPDFDGHSTSPISRLESIFGLQEVVNWMFNSRIANVRKALHNRWVVDPFLVFMDDILNPNPADVVRLRPEVWGTGVIEAAVKEFPVKDVTASHMTDVNIALELVQRVTGVTDMMQGIMRTGGERRSAQESRDTRSGALSRIEKTAKMIGLQCMPDIGNLLILQTQQLMSESTYVKLSGRVPLTIRQKYGLQDDQIEVDPMALLVDFDIVVKDGSVPSGEHAQTWIQLLQAAQSIPQLASVLDYPRVFEHISTLLGAKNVEDFMIKPSIQPTEQVLQQVNAGNLITPEQAIAQ